MENKPSPKDIIDILAEVEYLKVSGKDIDVSLESSDTVNIQPKETPFGVKLKVKENQIVPTLTFDAKKLREPRKKINPKKLLDDAIDDYLKNDF